MHLGDSLVEEIIEHARIAGYKEMVLDTIVPLKTAISLYKKHGFETIGITKDVYVQVLHFKKCYPDQ